MTDEDVIVSRSEALYKINMMLWNLKQESPVINGVQLLIYDDVIDGIARIMVGLEDKSCGG